MTRGDKLMIWVGVVIVVLVAVGIIFGPSQ
jgi:cell division protein FtsL